MRTSTHKSVNYKTLTRREIDALLNRALEIHMSINEVKPLYRELDHITEKLVEAEVDGSHFERYKVDLVDNFDQKNTQFKIAFVRRWELKFTQAAQTAAAIQKKEEENKKKTKRKPPKKAASVTSKPKAKPKKKAEKKEGWDFPIKGGKR